MYTFAERRERHAEIADFGGGLPCGFDIQARGLPTPDFRLFDGDGNHVPGSGDQGKAHGIRRYGEIS
jgi:hypothetical protein